MSSASLQLFKRIVLHNKLMGEDDLEALLRDASSPEQAVKKMVEQKLVPVKTAGQLLAMYRKQVESQTDPSAAAALPPSHPVEKPAGTAPHDSKPTPHDSKPAPAAPQPAARPAASPSPSAASKSQPPLPLAQLKLDVSQGNLVAQLMQAARRVGASDLHIKSGMVPAVRIAGVLRDLPTSAIPPEPCEAALVKILNPDDRKVFLETSDLDFCYDGGPELGRFRANFLRQHQGMDAIFRLIPDRVPSFEELKLPEQVKKFTEYRVGIVLVTGPKGCGKTTTLAAMVDLINSQRAEHIITIEDPIEFVHPCKRGHVNQRQVGPHTRSFGNALRAALREAPDVIMVGEMRDLETTSLAITAAETGHLVLATLHTPDALRTIGRVLDVFPAREQGQIRAMLSESLRGIVSQLMTPSTDGQSLELAVEILVNTPAIGHLIREDRVFQVRGLMQTGKKLGMVLMDESLIKLAKEGRISKEDAISRAEEPVFVEKQLA